MRRPLFYIAIAYTLAIIIAYYISFYIDFLIVILLFICLLLFKIDKKLKRIIFILLISFLISSASYAIYEHDYNNSHFNKEESLSIQGKILTINTKHSSNGEDYRQLVIDPLFINGKKQKTNPLYRKKNIMFTDYEHNDINLIPGAKISIEGDNKIVQTKRNPNTFDYDLYLKSIGIDRVVEVKKIEIISNDKTIPGKLYLIKKKFIRDISKVIGNDSAGLIQGILFGEKNDIDKETLQEFQKNGTAHILAVSGLHIGIIYVFISKLWIFKKNRLYFILVTIFMLLYSILASFSPSVVRAVFMVELHMIAKLTNNRYDLNTAAFLIFLLVLIKNPWQLFHAGFQMSFIAVLTLFTIIPYIKRIYGGILVGSLAVQIGLTPYTIYTFNYFSVISVFINIPIIFLTGILVPMLLISFPLSLLPDHIFHLVLFVIDDICHLIDALNSYTCIDGITTYELTSPSRSFMAFYYLSILCFVSEEGRLLIMRRKKKIITVMILMVVGTSILFGNITKSGFEKCNLVFVDIGQGDCMHIKSSDNKNYLIDGGGNRNYEVGIKVVKPYLLKNGVRKIDGAFVTHLDIDHYKGIAELCRTGMVKKLILYEGNKERENEILNETGMKHKDVIYIAGGDDLALGKNLNVEVMWPNKETKKGYKDKMKNIDDENKLSLTMKIKYKNYEYMSTGDVDSESMDKVANLYDNNLNSDILKAPHHGSKKNFSQKFLNLTNPQYIVIQVGKNNYGHPSEEIISKYKRKKPQIFRTDEDGAIGFYKGKAMKVVTVIK